MKKNMRLLLVMMFTFFLLVGSNCYAAWWGTPSYEWGLTKGLTSIKTQSQLERKVTVSDYYNVILKYLNMKNVQPKNRIIQSANDGDIYNGAIQGIINDVNNYIDSNVTSLTPQQYRNLEELVDHAEITLDEQSDVLYRDDFKNINLYLDLAKYRGAMLLKSDTNIEKSYKNGMLYKLRNTKYAKSLSYGIMPTAATPTRRSFLVLMHNLLSDNISDSDTIIKSFNDAGVLLGYNGSLWLDEELKYSEMLAFLYRFEAYDFNPVSEEE